MQAGIFGTNITGWEKIGSQTLTGDSSTFTAFTIPSGFRLIFFHMKVYQKTLACSYCYILLNAAAAGYYNEYLLASSNAVSALNNDNEAFGRLYDATNTNVEASVYGQFAVNVADGGAYIYSTALRARKIMNTTINLNSVINTTITSFQIGVDAGTFRAGDILEVWGAR